jgi:hypothetical protein
VLALGAVTLALGGCSALGLGGSSGGGAASASPTPTGTPWFKYTAGVPTPSATISYGASRSAVLPPVSFLPVDPACTATFTRTEDVLIPLTVVPAKGSLKVTWPRQYNSGYRLTAVKQPLITGNQPAYTWQTVPAATGCTATATIKGLKSGIPYVVWLDAPNTGYERDGARHLYSGASGVVYPL